jgi:hypothetical protein
MLTESHDKLGQDLLSGVVLKPTINNHLDPPPKERGDTIPTAHYLKFSFLTQLRCTSLRTKDPSYYRSVCLAGAASYVTPYTYATLPQTAGLPTAAAGGFPGLSPYQTAAQATLQEARMQ